MVKVARLGVALKKSPLRLPARTRLPLPACRGRGRKPSL